ncbi:MAG: YbjN domain-containing protein [Clostridiales bacterium]|nr:YbjN domain-containing protein [Clostridiales bacterium]
MYQATMEIIQEFDSANIKYDAVDNQDANYSYVAASFKSKANTVVSIKFISNDDDGDAEVRAFSLAHIPDERLAGALKLVNELNRRFRYVKFVIGEDNDVNAEYDLPLRNANIGPCATEMFIRCMKIIDVALPELMHLIWA